MAITDTGADGTWAIGVNWPYPKVYFGRYYTLALAISVATGQLWVYELYCTTSDAWTATAVKSLGAIANIDSVAIADFGEFYAVSNFGITANTVYMDGFLRDPSGRLVDLPTASIPSFGTCCNFNGQAIIGCIKHSGDDHFGDMGYNTVAWSKIGKFDFRLAPLKSDEEYDGSFYINPDVGYKNMEWGEWNTGIVYKVKKLGKGVVVYGDGGRGFLYPVNEPVVSFGFKSLEGPGVRYADHVGGNEDEHVFIDEDNSVWRVSADKTEELGYSDYIDDLITADIQITHVPGRQRYYISDGVAGFCLTPQGMYSTNQLVSSAGLYRGTLCGFFLDDADYEARIETDVLDFGQRGMKTVSGLEVGGANYDGSSTRIEASIKFRYDHITSGFTQSSWVKLSPEGTAVILVTAPEVKLLARISDYRSTTMTLDYIKARLKMSDKRFIRGPRSASNIAS